MSDTKPSDYAVALLLKRRKEKAAAAPVADAADDEDAEGEAEPMGPKAELAAFKALKVALAGDDNAAGVSALKDFLKACGAYEGDEE